MVDALPDEEYRTSTETKEALRRATAPRERTVELWLAEATPDLVCQAKATPNLLPHDHKRNRDDRVGLRPRTIRQMDRGRTHLTGTTLTYA